MAKYPGSATPDAQTGCFKLEFVQADSRHRFSEELDLRPNSSNATKSPSSNSLSSKLANGSISVLPSVDGCSVVTFECKRSSWVFIIGLSLQFLASKTEEDILLPSNCFRIHLPFFRGGPIDEGMFSLSEISNCSSFVSVILELSQRSRFFMATSSCNATELLLINLPTSLDFGSMSVVLFLNKETSVKSFSLEETSGNAVESLLSNLLPSKLTKGNTSDFSSVEASTITLERE